MVDSSTKSATAVVLFGPTQASKSTTFLNLCGDFRADSADWSTVGDGSGESVTVETELRSSKIGLVLDTPGINDSKLRFTNAEAGRKVTLGVAASGVKKIRFIVFESLANDSVNLRQTFASLLESFGSNCLAGAIILATKADCLNEMRRKKRLEVITEIARNSGVQEVVAWQNECIDSVAFTAQVGQLKAALGRVPPVSTTDLEDLDRLVNERARELCKNAAPIMKQTTVQVEEQYVEPREVPETYQEPYVEPREEKEEYEETYVDYEERERRYTDTEPYEDTRTEEVSYQRIEEKPTIFKILTLGIVRDEIQNETKEVKIPITRYRTVERTCKEIVPVTKTRVATRTKIVYDQKTRSATRMKTVYDKKTRTKDVPKTVTVARGLETFMAEALQEVMAEIRNSLAKA